VFKGVPEIVIHDAVLREWAPATTLGLLECLPQVFCWGARSG
jgi:hypothetical protein